MKIEKIVKTWMDNNNPTIYAEGLSWYEAILILTSKLNDLIDQVNNYFDVDLEDVVIEILNEWKKDGVLDNIFEEVILNNKVNISEIVVNVKDFGAVGDGVADDSVAVQTASDEANGKVLFFPKGVYRVADINLPSDVYVFGDVGSVIKLIDMFPDNKYTKKSAFNASGANSIKLENLVFDGEVYEHEEDIQQYKTTHEKWDIVRFMYCKEVEIRGCVFKNTSSAGFSGTPGLIFDRHAFVTINGCEVVRLINNKFTRLAHNETMYIVTKNDGDKQNVLIEGNKFYDYLYGYSPINVIGGDCVVKDNYIQGISSLSSAMNVCSDNASIFNNTIEDVNSTFIIDTCEDLYFGSENVSIYENKIINCYQSTGIAVNAVNASIYDNYMECETGVRINNGVTPVENVVDLHPSVLYKFRQINSTVIRDNVIDVSKHDKAWTYGIRTGFAVKDKIISIKNLSITNNTITGVYNRSNSPLMYLYSIENLTIEGNTLSETGLGVGHAATGRRYFYLYNITNLGIVNNVFMDSRDTSRIMAVKPFEVGQDWVCNELSIHGNVGLPKGYNSIDLLIVVHPNCKNNGGAYFDGIFVYNNREDLAIPQYFILESLPKKHQYIRSDLLSIYGKVTRVNVQGSFSIPRVNSTEYTPSTMLKYSTGNVFIVVSAKGLVGEQEPANNVDVGDFITDGALTLMRVEDNGRTQEIV